MRCYNDLNEIISISDSLRAVFLTKSYHLMLGTLRHMELRLMTGLRAYRTYSGFADDFETLATDSKVRGKRHVVQNTSELLSYHYILPAQPLLKPAILENLRYI